MESLHNAEYSFPKAQDWIDNAPTEREIDRILDDMVERAWEWWLTDFFNTIHSELYHLEIHNPLYKWNTNTTDNRRDYVSEKDSTYFIQHEITYTEYDNKEVWKTFISIYFTPNSIRLTYSSQIQGFKEISNNSMQIYNIWDIKEILESELQPIPETQA